MWLIKNCYAWWTWAVNDNCSFFIVFATEMDDNIEQIKKDLHVFLYHLRLPAEVFVVPLVSTFWYFITGFLLLMCSHSMSGDKSCLCICHNNIWWCTIVFFLGGERTGGDHWDAPVLGAWRLPSRTWSHWTSPWTKQLTWLRIIHSGEWCQRLVLCIHSGACHKCISKFWFWAWMKNA